MLTEAMSIRAALAGMKKRVIAINDKVAHRPWPPSGDDYNELWKEVVSTLMAIESIKPQGGVLELLPKGETVGKDVLMMTQHVGKASHPEYGEFEMMTSMTYAPIIEHKGTGKKRVWSWSDLIDMAIMAEINK